MAGVVAGSVISNYGMYSPVVRLVALTVNNICNLKCPHCYLQYTGQNQYFPQSLQDTLLAQPFEHLAIVGMEPFVNKKTALSTIELAERARSAGKTVSAITNGYGLKFLDSHACSLFDFIDVSFDGGLETYTRFRAGDLTRLRESIDRVRSYGLPLNALHTLYQENIGNIDDMLTVLQFYDFQKVLFSPYVETMNEGKNCVGQIPLLHILKALVQSEAFRQEPKAYLLLDSYHYMSEKVDEASVKAELARLKLSQKVHVVPHTPLQVGSIRVTYDGLIMSPATALHTAMYKSERMKLGNESLAAAYQEFLEEEHCISSSNLALAAGA